MKRRSFIKISSLTGLAIATLPSYSFSISEIDTDELIGKGSPVLYGDGFKLRKQAYKAFIKMRDAALKEGINIQVVSSYRDFNHQKKIWNRKFKSFTKQGLLELDVIQKIIEYSTIPGTSRHHWGTDLDIIDAIPEQPRNVLQTRHFEGRGPFSKLKKWMDKNANMFGFYLVYTDNENRKGFKYEPWHYSYEPLSKIYLKEFNKLEIKKILSNEDIMGIDSFSEEFIQGYIKDNILDINPKLLS